MSKRVVQGRSASSLFLIELIVAIGFFAVASAVCLQLFVQARLLSLDSTDLSRATLAAQSSAEGFRAADGSLSDAARLLGGSLEGENSLLLWYDAAWQPTTKQNAAYQLVLTADQTATRPIKADIALQRLSDSRELYRLSVKTPGDSLKGGVAP